MAHNLRYIALGIYGGLIALWTVTDKISLDATTVTGLLAPIVLILGADFYKHRNDGKPVVT